MDNLPTNLARLEKQQPEHSTYLSQTIKQINENNFKKTEFLKKRRIHRTKKYGDK